MKAAAFALVALLAAQVRAAPARSAAALTSTRCCNRRPRRRSPRQTLHPQTAQAASAAGRAAADKALGAKTSRRAVVVIQGGGLPHPYTTPWAACAGEADPYIRDLRAAGLPVFTAPGY